MALYSHTQLRTFEDCPLKYKFRYIDKIKKPEEQTIEAFVGSCVHAALEKLYADLALCKQNSLDDLLASYRETWEKNWLPSIKIVREEFTPQNYFDYGAGCIRNYFERYKPFDQSRTLATEAHLIFPLDPPGTYKMQGYVDRIARRPDGTYEIHDYKTGRSLPSQAEVDSDHQLGLYQIGLQARWPDAERVELIWHYVGKDTLLRSRRTAEQLQSLRQETIETIGRIQSEKEFPPHPSGLCDWCEYRPDCPVWKHVAAMELLPPAQFAADEGVHLADDYAKTKDEMDRLARRLDQLRELILEFCRQKQASVLAGHSVRVAVKFGERTKFPGKNDPGRESLEEFIRRLGRWEEVSDVSASELAKILQEKRWAPELLEQLRRFATAEPTSSVHVTRSKDREE
ncbi:MAG: PD-(D/E)XK nuclease family protein [Acidobacteriia bacterium]|nr:PD-(D/E)XK nuclease family protein [Terriglobia bacterium]